jgi:hypothetical protein
MEISYDRRKTKRHQQDSFQKEFKKENTPMFDGIVKKSKTSCWERRNILIFSYVTTHGVRRQVWLSII